MKRSLLPLLLLWTLNVLAQTDSVPASNLEIGLNISNVLANFFNSDFPRAELEKHSLALKYGNVRTAWRLHLGINRTQESAQFGFGNNTSFSVYSKFGREWRYDITPAFQLIYGVDAIINYSSEVSAGETLLKITSYNSQVGGGAFLGFRYHLLDKLILTTESLFSVLHNMTNTKVVSAGNTDTFKDVGTLIQHSLPVSLYLYIKL